MAAERVRTYLNQGDLLRVGTRAVGPDGRERWGYTQYADADGFLYDWLWSTATNASQLCSTDRRYVQWSLGEVSTLFRKLLGWWEDEGRSMLAASHPISPLTVSMSAGPLRQRVRLILDVIRDVIMPRVGRRNRLANDIVGVVDSFEQEQLPTHAIRPALLKYRSNTEEAAAAYLLAGLTSTDETTYFQSVRGLLFWLRTQSDPDKRPLGFALRPSPPELLRQLGANLAGRRQPGLRITLDAANTLLSEIPRAADPAFLTSVRIGLQSLLSEATYRIGVSASALIPEEEIPQNRLLIARLARQLSNIPGGDAPVVQEWIRLAAADPLPEVRQAVALADQTD
jgi:hypothetical protein